MGQGGEADLAVRPLHECLDADARRYSPQLLAQAAPASCEIVCIVEVQPVRRPAPDY